MHCHGCTSVCAKCPGITSEVANCPHRPFILLAIQVWSCTNFIISCTSLQSYATLYAFFVSLHLLYLHNVSGRRHITALWQVYTNPALSDQMKYSILTLTQTHITKFWWVSCTLSCIVLPVNQTTCLPMFLQFKVKGNFVLPRHHPYDILPSLRKAATAASSH